MNRSVVFEEKKTCTESFTTSTHVLQLYVYLLLSFRLRYMLENKFRANSVKYGEWLCYDCHLQETSE